MPCPNYYIKLVFTFSFQPSMTNCMGPSIKYVTLFWPIYPLPLSHFVTHPGTPKSTSHISDPPIFSRPSTKNRDKSLCTKFLSIIREGFCPGVFCLEGFLSVPLSVRIHLLQQKVKNHFNTLTAVVFITST